MKNSTFLVLLVALGVIGYHWLSRHVPHRFDPQGVVRWTEPDPDGFLAYRRRMLQFTLPDTARAAEESRQLFGQLRRGQLTREQYALRSRRLMRRLEDLNDDVTGRSTPDDFLAPARALARGQGGFYRCLGRLQKLPADPAARQQAFDQAWQDWLLGWKELATARQGIRVDVTFKDL